MAAYLIAISSIKDSEKLQEYGANAGPTLGAYGGKPVARGPITDSLTGSIKGDVALIVRFDDAASVRRWYESPEYQACLAVREQAIDANFIVLEEPPA